MRKHAWSKEELDALRTVYESAGNSRSIRLSELAKTLGKSAPNVSRKARELGLTNKRRGLTNGAVGKQLTIFRDPVLQAARAGVITKAYIAAIGHPRGMAGKKHKIETLAALASSSKRMWSDPASAINAPAQTKRRREEMYARIASGEMRGGYTRARGGRREDIGQTYFRSSWEANYARYLNFLVKHGEILAWEYEPKTFCFEPIKKGCRFYTPDFLVHQKNGCDEWHEVKGWMDQKSKTRLRRMAKYFPGEIVRVIDEKWFRNATKNLAGMIPGWETGRERFVCAQTKTERQ